MVPDFRNRQLLLKRFPELLVAVRENEYVIANGYFSGAVPEENFRTLSGREVCVCSDMRILPSVWPAAEPGRDRESRTGSEPARLSRNGLQNRRTAGDVISRYTKPQPPGYLCKLGIIIL